MDYLRRTWANIDLDCVAHNYREVRKQLKAPCKMMAVVKADAYGHGDRYTAQLLQDEGAEWFAVSNINEAFSLRRQKITRPILILGYTPTSRADELSQYEISQTLLSLDYARELSAVAHAKGLTIDCHISVDTGMSRLGFFAQHGHTTDAAADIAIACALPGLKCTGIYTHFSSADDLTASAKAYTEAQYRTFQAVLKLLNEKGLTFPLKHCCNSAATITHPDWHMDIVRPGVILYGMNPSNQLAGLIDLQPAMSLYTTVAMVKAVEAGVSVSYDRRYTTRLNGQKIGTLEAGYADGYRRSFTNKGMTIINGYLAPVIGAVCMDQIMVEASFVPNIKAGDLVTLVGKDGYFQITFDDFARINGTINYEETCLIGRRVPRVYYQNGKEIAVVDYVLASLPK